MGDLRYDPKHQCTATAKQTGERCRRSAAPGCTVCTNHGGAAPQVREAGRRRLLLAEHAALIGELLAEMRGDADPQRDLADALALAGQMRRLYQLLVSELSTAPGAEGIFGPDHNGDAKPHTLVSELHRWTETQAKLSKLALDVGLDERRVQVEEAKVSEVERLVTAALTELGVPMSTAGPVLARHLRALPAA